MIGIRTPSRLHFGLLSIAASDASFGRRFGGVGLMVDRPGIELLVEPARVWHAEGPLAERALTFAKRYCDATDLKQAFRLTIKSTAPEHAGLGTGTQLGLAVAHGIVRLVGRPTVDAAQLAKQVGRGLRSSLGIHGFQQGGFLVEGGKTPGTDIAPLLCRHDFPDDWHVLLITFPGLAGTHGRCEIDAFANLAARRRDDHVTDALCRIVLLGMLPALLERDLPTFGDAVYDFNRHVGEMFHSAQGGVYAHPHIEAIVQKLRSAGVKGVGQSSWGPTVFAVVPATEAEGLRMWLARQLGVDVAIAVVQACNRGVVV